MNWYVRWDATDEISGPMTKTEAIDATSDGSGMPFSEKIFEQEFVTTEEVETLLAEIRSRVNEKQQGLTSVCVKELLAKAADTIVLLSQKVLDKPNSCCIL